LSSPGKNKTSSKTRLDALLVARGLAENQSKAAAVILSGEVFSGTRRLDKPGEMVKSDIAIEVKPRKAHGWVSRGGLKLEHAITHFHISVKDAVCIDIGASTGGFTDVLLTHGAAKVYAVDVGYGELAWKLQQDSRVVVMDRTNARHLTKEQVPQPLDILVSDVSFISLKLVLPPAMALASEGARLMALIKPQFEAPRAVVDKAGGILTDPAIHEAVCRDIEGFIADMPGWDVLGVVPSPILGQEGNKEFLIAAAYHAH
jgi:23S rRNA (cytidine1920-2'-O)/16S rRNA (cytidine1409-2'-O)-methyltransferase